jgi:hypothetical protein
MAAPHCLPTEEATALLDKLTQEQRDYVLFRLVSAKFEGEQPLMRVPVYRPDGTVFGYIQPPEPPSAADVTAMHDRARRVDPEMGRPTSELLELMTSGDEKGVRKFIH